MLAGCGASQPIGLGAVSQSRATATHAGHRASWALPGEQGTGKDLARVVRIRNNSLRYLFVGNINGNHGQGDVSVYRTSGSHPIQVIVKGIGQPNALGVDGDGNVYVANNDPLSVTVYAPLTGKLFRTMTFGVNGPDALALDKAGNVFVANFLGQSITEYAAGKTKGS